MNTKEPTCAERIADQLASEEENLKAIYDVLDGNYDEQSEESEGQQLDNAYSELHEYALGMETKQKTIITLSWGGPASYLEVTHQNDDIESVVYRFSDWFDTATKTITDENSALYRYAQEMINIQVGAY